MESYGGRIRVRVGALIFDEADRPDALLLVEHGGLFDDRPFWTPPGGGVEFGESLEEALRREVSEETGLDVEIGPLRYTLQFLRPPLHAVSFYFQVRITGGSLGAGRDPELETQLIRSARYVSFDELNDLVVVPDALPDALRTDAPIGFSRGVRYLGAMR